MASKCIEATSCNIPLSLSMVSKWLASTNSQVIVIVNGLASDLPGLFSSGLFIQDASAFPLDALAAMHKCDADTKAVFQAGPGHGHGGSRTRFLQDVRRSLLWIFWIRFWGI